MLYTHRYILDKEAGKADARIRCRVKFDGHTVAFLVGYRVDIDKWSEDVQRCKNNTTHGKRKIAATFINRELNRMDLELEKIFSELAQHEIHPTPTIVKDAIKASITAKADSARLSFVEIYDRFTSEVGVNNLWTSATYQKFSTLKTELLEFNPHINLKSFSTQGLYDYIAYLRDEKKMRNSTIGKKIGFVKWFLRWATAQGYNKDRSFETFSPKFKTTEKKVIFLEWGELMTLYDFEFPDNKNYLARCRDIFCLSCFTSLRYSDVMNLRKSDVFEDYIEVTTVKTSDSLRIELNKYSRTILDRYKDEIFPKGAAMPPMSNQRMNDYIKEAGEMVGIDTPIRQTYYQGNNRIDEVHPKWQLLSTHAGRRTFICNALMMGIPPHIVMKWTGHSDYKAMKPYIAVADSAKSDAMKLFDR